MPAMSRPPAARKPSVHRPLAPARSGSRRLAGRHLVLVWPRRDEAAGIWATWRVAEGAWPPVAGPSARPAGSCPGWPMNRRNGGAVDPSRELPTLTSLPVTRAGHDAQDQELTWAQSASSSHHRRHSSTPVAEQPMINSTITALHNAAERVVWPVLVLMCCEEMSSACRSAAFPGN